MRGYADWALSKDGGVRIQSGHQSGGHKTRLFGDRSAPGMALPISPRGVGAPSLCPTPTRHRPITREHRLAAAGRMSVRPYVTGPIRIRNMRFDRQQRRRVISGWGSRTRHGEGPHRGPSERPLRAFVCYWSAPGMLVRRSRSSTAWDRPRSRPARQHVRERGGAAAGFLPPAGGRRRRSAPTPGITRLGGLASQRRATHGCRRQEDAFDAAGSGSRFADPSRQAYAAHAT